jgi:hypothetical protein
MKPEDLFVLNYSSTLAITLNCMQKLYFEEPRPYFLDDNLDAAATCSKDMEYGQPSGHLMCNAAGYLLLVYMLSQDYIGCSKLTGYSLITVLISFLFFNRLYLGVHSYDQLICGLLQGISIFLIMTSSEVHSWMVKLRTENMPNQSVFKLLFNPILVVMYLIAGFSYTVYFPDKAHSINDICKSDSKDLKYQGPEQASMGYVIFGTSACLGVYLGAIL